jgi:hypothetical protein
MQNKLLVAVTLSTVLSFVGNVSAANQQNGNIETGSENQTQQQTKTINQSEEDQVQTRNAEQVQNETNNLGETAPQSQTQSEVQQQNNNVASQQKSQVATAVQQMLQIANRNGGIGQQVRAIAQTQTQNQEKLETSLQKIQERERVLQFIIGPDYGEINNAKNLLNQNREQIQQLNQLKTQLYSQSDMQNLAQQIQVLEQANLQIENSLRATQGKISLFGWLFRLFA